MIDIKTEAKIVNDVFENFTDQDKNTSLLSTMNGANQYNNMSIDNVAYGINITKNAYWVGRNLGLTQHDKMCIPVPLFHCFGCVLSTLNCVIHGATMVLVKKFNPEDVFSIEQLERWAEQNGFINTQTVKEHFENN